jgi:hypothetical protein
VWWWLEIAQRLHRCIARCLGEPIFLGGGTEKKKIEENTMCAGPVVVAERDAAPEIPLCDQHRLRSILLEGKNEVVAGSAYRRGTGHGRWKILRRSREDRWPEEHGERRHVLGMDLFLGEQRRDELDSSMPLEKTRLVSHPNFLILFFSPLYSKCMGVIWKALDCALRYIRFHGQDQATGMIQWVEKKTDVA